jgi:hypothetical protein
MFAIFIILWCGSVGGANSPAIKAHQQMKVVVTREFRVSRVRGIVVDPVDAPIQGAEVVLVRGTKDVNAQGMARPGKQIVSVHTNERGAFFFSKLRPGRYGLLIRKFEFDEMYYQSILLNRRVRNRRWMRFRMELAT